MLPPHYLNITRIMQLEISNGRVTKKSDAYPLFKFSPSKIDRIYDMLVEKGVVQEKWYALYSVMVIIYKVIFVCFYISLAFLPTEIIRRQI